MSNHTLHEYVGSVHIHSDYSDGHSPIPEIAKIAHHTGLDFLMFNDHMTLEPLRDGMQRWYDSVLAIIGYEINDDSNRNHYLVYGLEKILPDNLSVYEYVKSAHDSGAVGFIAHPDEKRSSLPAHPPYPWVAWDAEGFDGIEIWNHSSEWLESLTPLNKYFRIWHPLKYLEGPGEEILARWDELNRTQVVVGIGGTDAHAYPYKIGPLTVQIFRYKVLFKGIRTHVLLDEELTEDVERSVAVILQALKNARCFISHHRWGDARGFRFYALTGNTRWLMGDTVTAEQVQFTVESPASGHISLLRDGQVVAASNSTALSYVTETSGAYRVEIKKEETKSWIYSNHIRFQRTTNG